MRIGAAVLLFVVAVAVAFPYGLSYGIGRWLGQHGAEKVELSHVGANLFTGRFSIRGAQIQRNPYGPASVAEVSGNIALHSLFGGHLVFQHLLIRNADFWIARDKDGTWRYGGITLPGGAGGGGRRVGFDLIEIENSHVRIEVGDVKTEIDVRTGRIEDLIPWRPDETTTIVVDGSVNGAGVTLHLAAAPFSQVPSLNGNVQIAGLDLGRWRGFIAGGGGNGLALDGKLSLDGKVRAAFSGHTVSVAQFDGSMSAAGLVLRRPKDGVGISTGSLAWQGPMSWSADENGGASLDGTLSGRSVELALTQGRRMSAAALEVKGKGSVPPTLAPDGVRFTGAAAVDGPRLSGFARALPVVTAESLDLTGIDVNGLADLGVGAASVSGLALRTPGTAQGPQGQGAQGQGAQGQGAQGQGAQGQGALGQGTRAASAGGAAFATARAVTVSKLHRGAGTISTGAVAIDHILLNSLLPGRRASPAAGDGLALADMIRADSLQMQGAGNVVASGLTLEGLTMRALRPADAKTGGGAEPFDVVTAASAATARIALSDGRVLEIAPLAIHGARIAFLRTGGTLIGPNSLLTAAKPAAAAPAKGTAAPEDDGGSAASGTPPAPAKRRFVLRLHEVTLDDQSAISFRDEMVRPTFERSWQLSEARITGLDGADPETPGHVEIKGALGPFASAAVTGTLQPFADAFQLKVRLDVNQVNLQELSPYLRSKTGYVFTSGQAGVDADISVKVPEISALAKVDLNNMDVKQASSSGGKAPTGSIGLPLESALGLLRDNQRDIHVTIPVSGNIRSPRFDLSSVIAEAIANGLKKASMTFLKLALQPWGSIMLLTDLAQQFSSAVQLEPVPFLPGKASISREGEAYLGRVGHLLQERPDLRLKMCGRSTPADRRALAEALKVKPEAVPHRRLRVLAESRAKLAKGFLVNQRKVDPGRLFLCAPEYDATEGAKPRVDLLL